METFTAFLKQISQVFRWWVMVAPWEQALRVRAGRHVTRLSPGVHLRVPFLDTVYVQSVRMRLATMSMQTVMTRDRQALTVAGALGYAVGDIEQLYRTLHHAEDTLTNLSMNAVAECAARERAADLTPEKLAQLATHALTFTPYGLVDVSIRITDFAFLRTYRLVSDARWGTHGDSLNVERAPV
jgi:regulator of protease activity HflC (stomatin/prohibitin superfamily)